MADLKMEAAIIFEPSLPNALRRNLERPGLRALSGTLTRRQMVKMLASVGVGLVASPPLSGKELGTRMVAAIFFESYATVALRRALRYAGDDGFVASMPQLLHARVNASYDNVIWNTWFTANSEESVVTTPLGNHVVVTVHGGGIFAKPARFERSLRADLNRYNSEGLTGQYAAKISEIEARDVLRGHLPDGTEIPVYPFDEFKRGVAKLPMRYAVVLDFEMARKSTRGYDPFDVLKDEPNFIVRAGGIEAAAAYLDKARDRHNTTVMGNWHPYNRIDPDQPQTRVAFLAGNLGGVGTEDDDDHLYGYDAEYGMGGDATLGGMARYVAVAPHDVSTSLRNLDFGS
jgi:hypothetical protein